jgi:glycosyltransferase involved in cell wall biosynthesis
MSVKRSELPARTSFDRSAPQLTVLAAPPTNEADGIHEYTRRLVATLEDHADVQVDCENPRAASVDRLAAQAAASAGRTPTFLLQYNPFQFGRWGFAPWLPAKLWRLKRSAPRPRLAVMFHELYYPITDWRSAVMGGWQRVQFFAVWLLADVVFTSVGPWATKLQSQRPRRPVHHLPVASNLPDMRDARAAMRERLKIDDDAVVLAAFGSGHPSRLLDYVAYAANSLASEGRKTVVLNLGFNTPPLDVTPRVTAVTPGHLEEHDVACHLAAADIYLAPFSDGVSTRRTTLMAALQHGLPVVGTSGHLTGGLLRGASGALRLTPVGDRDAFAAVVRELAASPAERSELGARARALYEREFDWPVVCDRLLAGLEGSPPAPPARQSVELEPHATRV